MLIRKYTDRPVICGLAGQLTYNVRRRNLRKECVAQSVQFWVILEVHRYLRPAGQVSVWVRGRALSDAKTLQEDVAVKLVGPVAGAVGERVVSILKEQLGVAGVTVIESGKLAFGLWVRQLGGGPCSVWQAAVRTIARLVEVNPIVLGAIPAGIVILASTNRQRIGDVIAGTVVRRGRSV